MAMGMGWGIGLGRLPLNRIERGVERVVETEREKRRDGATERQIDRDTETQTETEKGKEKEKDRDRERETKWWE